MARTIQYWYDVIVTEKQTMGNLNGLQPSLDTSQTLLSDVTTKSRVARWRLWVWAVAAAMYAFDVLFDLQKLDLEDIAQRNRFGTEPWYVQMAKEFQYGYNLVWVNNSFSYSVVDPTAQIIKLAAYEEIAEGDAVIVIMKVANLSGNTPIALTSPETTAFNVYVKRRKPPGIVVRVITGDGDDVMLYLRVLYDALILSATGESLLFSGIFPVEDTINTFIKNLPFNGTLELCDLVEAIKNTTGISAAYVTYAAARYGTRAFVQFDERYVANNGYLKIDVGTALNTSITYEANV